MPCVSVKGVRVKGWVLSSTYVISMHMSAGVYPRDAGSGVGQGWVVPVPVNERIEGQAIPPAGGEILDVYLRVTGSMEGRNRGRDGDSQKEKEGGRERETETDGWVGGWIDDR